MLLLAGVFSELVIRLPKACSKHWYIYGKFHGREASINARAAESFRKSLLGWNRNPHSCFVPEARTNLALPSTVYVHTETGFWAQ